MSSEPIAQLLASYPPAPAELAASLVAAIVELRPDLDPAARPGWGSVNFRHRRAGFVCAVFPSREHVDLVFEHGRLLSSPLLEGTGRQVRFIRLRPGVPMPRDEIAILLAEAIALRA